MVYKIASVVLGFIIATATYMVVSLLIVGNNASWLGLFHIGVWIGSSILVHRWLSTSKPNIQIPQITKANMWPIVAGVLICVVVALLVYIVVSSPEDQSESTSEVVQPAYTLQPTYTPQPTWAPAPTPTPIPIPPTPTMGPTPTLPIILPPTPKPTLIPNLTKEEIQNLFLLGYNSYTQKKYSDAVNFYDKGINEYELAGYSRLDNTWTHSFENALNNRSSALYKLGSFHFNEALDGYEKLIELFPNSETRGLYAINKGNIYYSLKDFGAAIRTYTDLITSADQFSDTSLQSLIHYFRGEAYSRIGNCEYSGDTGCAFQDPSSNDYLTSYELDPDLLCYMGLNQKYPRWNLKKFLSDRCNLESYDVILPTDLLTPKATKSKGLQYGEVLDPNDVNNSAPSFNIYNAKPAVNTDVFLQNVRHTYYYDCVDMCSSRFSGELVNNSSQYVGIDSPRGLKIVVEVFNSQGLKMGSNWQIVSRTGPDGGQMAFGVTVVWLNEWATYTIEIVECTVDAAQVWCL